MIDPLHISTDPSTTTTDADRDAAFALELTYEPASLPDRCRSLLQEIVMLRRVLKERGVVVPD